MEEEGLFVLLLVVAARFPQERAHVGWLRRPQTKRQGTRPHRATGGPLCADAFALSQGVFSRMRTQFISRQTTKLVEQ